MHIHEKIYDLAIDRAKELSVKDVRIGFGYTLVELEGGVCGLAYSFTKELNIQTCTVLDEAGSLVGKRASFLLEKIFSYNLLDSALALACANAILNSGVSEKDIDVVGLIEPEDSVVMIGYFSPLIEPIKKKTDDFKICERSFREGTLPDYAAYFELKKADVALITATSIINKTIDSLLELAKNARIKAIIGPSTPMDKRIFEGKATHLCGSVVVDIELAKRVVSEAGGTRKLKPATKKMCVVV